MNRTESHSYRNKILENKLFQFNGNKSVTCLISLNVEANKLFITATIGARTFIIIRFVFMLYKRQSK